MCLPPTRYIGTLGYGWVSRTPSWLYGYHRLTVMLYTYAECRIRIVQLVVPTEDVWVESQRRKRNWRDCNAWGLLYLEVGKVFWLYLLYRLFRLHFTVQQLSHLLCPFLDSDSVWQPSYKRGSSAAMIYSASRGSCSFFCSWDPPAPLPIPLVYSHGLFSPRWRDGFFSN